MTASRLTPRVSALTTLIGDRYGRGSTEYRLSNQLKTMLPVVIDQMARVCPDGYPTSTPGASGRDGGGGSSSLDTLGNLVARREHPTASYAALCALVGDATADLSASDRQGMKRALNACLRIADEWQPKVDTEAIVRAQKCTSPAADHVESWYRADCENVAAPGRQGLCDACHMRKWRAGRIMA